MAEENVEKKKGSPVKLIVIILVFLIVVGGSIGAGLYFGGFFSGAEESVEGKEGDKGKAKKEKEKEQAKAKAPAIYVALDPAFVVNFTDPEAKARFLQVTASVLTRDAAVEQAIVTNTPAIRSKLGLLFSTQKQADLNTTEGREKLSADALAIVREILARETQTDGSGAEEFLITSLVMQ